MENQEILPVFLCRLFYDCGVSIGKRFFFDMQGCFLSMMQCSHTDRMYYKIVMQITEDGLISSDGMR